MKTLSVAMMISAIGLAFAVASPAEAAAKGKHKKSAASHSMKHRQGVAVIAGAGLAGGVMSGPLYNGQDYIGDDPDPNIRSYLIRDMTRYRGSY